jgi:hypothetical protein
MDDLKKKLPQLTKEQQEIIDFWSVRGYEKITHCLGMSISLHLKDRYVHNGLCLQYLEQFRDKYLKESKTMQNFSEVIKIIEAGLEGDRIKAIAYANLLTNKVNERQSQMIIDRITGEYKKKKVMRF